MSYIMFGPMCRRASYIRTKGERELLYSEQGSPLYILYIYIYEQSDVREDVCRAKASGGMPANRSYVSILLVARGPRGRRGLYTSKKIMNFIYK